MNAKHRHQKGEPTAAQLYGSKKAWRGIGNAVFGAPATGETYFVTALENTPARLIASETRTTSKAIAEMVEAALKAEGFIVTTRTEG